mgnify:CR=1
MVQLHHRLFSAVGYFLADSKLIGNEDIFESHFYSCRSTVKISTAENKENSIPPETAEIFTEPLKTLTNLSLCVILQTVVDI